MNTRKRILFVCTANRMRSLTAEEIYREDPRFEVMSAGTSRTARVPLTHALLEWADAIIVMETAHRNAIRKYAPEQYARKRIVCLYIPDEFPHGDPGLILLLRERFEAVLRNGLC